MMGPTMGPMMGLTLALLASVGAFALLVVLVTWLHLAKREVLEVHPRGDRRNPLTGVFATRSPHRPNPLGLHRVIVREIAGARLRVGPIETLDGTPVVDIKIALS